MTSSATPTTNPIQLDKPVETLLVNTIRMLAADAVQEAKSGHAGMPMGMAQAAVTLWTRYLRYNPHNAQWANRDRFVLSAGHGSMLLYALLHLTGYDLSLDDLKNFRQWDSKTPGHPEHGHTPGVETTTGPLGQGFANGVGMALAERWLAEHFNRPDFSLIDHYTYAIVSDGDLMEGVASEAASLAGHLRLGKLIYLYDDNHVTIDGYTKLAYSEDWAQRFTAYGWHVQSIDGMDGDAVAAALEAAHADPRPSLIGCKTIIGYGSPKLGGTPKAHSDAFGEEELAKTRAYLGFPEGSRFYVPEAVQALQATFVERGQALEAAYSQQLAAYRAAYPQAAAELQQMLSGELPAGWQNALPNFAPGTAVATRNTSGDVINALAAVIPNLIGGSADLAASNKNTIKNGGDLTADSFAGRNIHFGVREHGMAGVLNGMALHGGVIPFGATFFVFTDYMRASVRLAALSKLPVTYVLTHDSVGVGEDGPTHQPVEQLAALRAIPNLTVIRPADANEAVQAWRLALEKRTGPTALVLTRQNLPIFDRAAAGMGAAEDARRGGYTFYRSSDEAAQLILIATGSEVTIAYEAAQHLAAEGVRVQVVSLPSWEVFAAQPADYRRQVLPLGTPKVSIEAGVSFGWERWVGNDPSQGTIIGVDHFGASAPYQRIYQEFGLTAENVVAQAKRLLG
ncbi:MAG: transketolase [Caldilineaceae bacterium]|nr:transketolase [Caldilineaceae bacterium]